MATSLDTTYLSTGNRIIQDAYEHLRIKQKGQNLDADDQAQAERYLNNIVKDWQKDGLHLWKEKEAAVFLESGRRTYTLGNQTNFRFDPTDSLTTNNPVKATQGDWVATTLTANALAAQPVIDVTALTGYSGTPFNTGNTSINVAVEDNNGSLQWSTLASVSTLELTLADNLTVASDSGNRVFIYFEHLDKPLKILQDNVRLWEVSGNETPLYSLAFTDYNLLPDKGATGVPVQVFYQPQIDTGELAIWPVSTDETRVILFRYMAEIEIFDASYTQDLPPEWIRALGWALASELGASKGVALPRQQALDMRASSLKEQVLEWDQDNSSLFLFPRTWG
jgi:hypothetical protein